MRCVVLVLGAWMITALPAVAGDIRVEAEHMQASHNLGGASIATKSCSAASGGLAVDGLDVDGEWLEFQITVPKLMQFRVSARSAGALDLVRYYRILIYAVDSESAEILNEVETLPGTGFG